MKRCLIILDQPEHAPALLNAAAQLVALTGLHTLDILALRPSAKPSTLSQAPTEAFLFEEQHRGRLAALHTQFCHWLQTEYRHAQKQVEDTTVNWHVLDVKNSLNIKNFLQKSDLVLATMPQAATPGTITETVLFELEHPVLLLPPHWDGAYGTSVLVVWDNSECAHKIVQASHTLLAHATLLHLIAPEGVSLPYGLLPPVMVEEQRLGLPFSLARVVHTAATARLAYPADMVVLGFDWARPMPNQQASALPNSPVSAALQAVQVPLLLWGGVGGQHMHAQTGGA